LGLSQFQPLLLKSSSAARSQHLRQIWTLDAAPVIPTDRGSLRTVGSGLIEPIDYLCVTAMQFEASRQASRAKVAVAEVAKKDELEDLLAR